MVAHDVHGVCQYVDTGFWICAYVSIAIHRRHVHRLAHDIDRVEGRILLELVGAGLGDLCLLGLEVLEQPLGLTLHRQQVGVFVDALGEGL